MNSSIIGEILFEMRLICNIWEQLRGNGFFPYDGRRKTFLSEDNHYLKSEKAFGLGLSSAKKANV